MIPARASPMSPIRRIGGCEPFFFSRVHAGPRVRPLPGPRTSSGRYPYVDGPRLARVVQQKRLRSIAVICPAFVRGTVAAGPDGVRGSGPKHGGGVEDTNGHHW